MDASVSTSFPWASGEYGLSGCHVLAFLPQLLASKCLDRNWKWIAAVQHLQGEDQILNPKLSSFPGKLQCSEEVLSATKLCHTPFLLVIVVSSLQSNYFSKLGYLVPCQRHFLWVNKSGFQNCVLASLIFIDIILFTSLLPFRGFLLSCNFHVQKVHRSSWLWCWRPTNLVYLYLCSLIVCQLKFTEQLLCARQRARHFICVSLIDPHCNLWGRWCYNARFLDEKLSYSEVIILFQGLTAIKWWTQHLSPGYPSPQVVL